MKATCVQAMVQRTYLSRRVVTVLLAVTLAVSPIVQADGMLPETSVVIVNEADGEATIKVRNTDPKPALLYVNLLDIPEDKQPLLLVSPAVSRVDADQSQVVRFILRTDAGPLKAQRLKRVTFEGKGAARIGVGVRQNLPVIIHPKGLAAKRDPWTLLKWSQGSDTLTLANDSAYVVRLAQRVTLLPMNLPADLPRTYVLPGERLTVALPEAARGAASVRLHPATVYGFTVDAYDAPLH
jgi:P pilus assembly chaperone PapD